MRLKGKTALISGAGRDSGKVIALTFAREGADLILIAQSSGHTAAVVASKMGLHGLIKSLAQALAPYGIRANLVGLANIDNKDRLNPELYKGVSDAVRTAMDNPERAKLLPMRRKATHQEVANVVLFPASDESSYVTGDRILCTGGMQV